MYFRQGMGWQLWVQCSLGRLYFWEQLFTIVCSAKHATLLAECGWQSWEIFQMEAHGSYRNQRCSKQETWTSNLLYPEDQGVPVVMVIFHSHHQKAKRKCSKLGVELNRWPLLYMIEKKIWCGKSQYGNFWTVRSRVWCYICSDHFIYEPTRILENISILLFNLPRVGSTCLSSTMGQIDLLKNYLYFYLFILVNVFVISLLLFIRKLNCRVNIWNSMFFRGYLVGPRTFLYLPIILYFRATLCSQMDIVS